MRIRFLFLFLMTLCMRNAVAEDILQVVPQSIVPGSTSADARYFTLEMKNDETFTAFQFDIYLPEGMELDEVGPIVFSDRFPSTPGRPNQIPIYTHVYDCRRHDKDGVFWRVIVYSTKNDPISGNSGDLLYMYYVTDESLKPGIHPVQIKNVVMAISGTQDVKPDDSSSFFYAEGYDASSVGKLDFSGLTGYVAPDVVAKTNEMIAGNESLTEMDLSSIDEAGGTFVSANPNCLRYVRQGTPIAESMNGENNVVEMSDNGNTCSRYVLTDGYDANVSVPFTAASASYSRTVPSAGWYSLCLPYSVPAKDGMTVEHFESLDAQKAIINFVDGGVEANVPCIFRTESTKVDFTAENVSVETTPDKLSDGLFMGTYATIDNEELNGGYALHSDGRGFGSIGGTTYIPPFRAYVAYKSDIELMSVVHGGTTGLSAVDGYEGRLDIYNDGQAVKVKAIAGNEIVYVRSMDGRLLNTQSLNAGESMLLHLEKGIYLINNKKVIVK